MLKRPCASARSASRLIVVAVGAAGLITAAVTEAGAQSAICQNIQPMLTQRKEISGKLSAGAKGKLDARVACSGFNQLVSNGQTLIKWVDANKDWCQIPEAFVGGIKADHEKAISIRARACKVAAQQTEMDKRAREGGGGGAGGLLGGGGLAGQQVMPQGAL